MITTLKRKIKESYQPIGIKKYSNQKLPQENFSYGLPIIPDKEGVSIRKKKKKKIFF